MHDCITLLTANQAIAAVRLVNAVGKLVGVTASGGAGRFEAVPASQISDLRAQSGPGQKEKSASIGKNLRECTLMLEKAQRMGSFVAGEVRQRGQGLV